MPGSTTSAVASSASMTGRRRHPARRDAGGRQPALPDHARSPSRRRRRAGPATSSAIRPRRRPGAACGHTPARRSRSGRAATAACSKRSAADSEASLCCSGSTSGPDVTAPGRGDEPDDRVVLGGRRTRPRTAPSNGRSRPAAHAAADRAAQREPVGALAQRHGVVDRVADRLGLALRAQRAEVGDPVGADLADHRQPRERLVGELEPDRSLRELRPAVVARFVCRDQAQFADLGLERVRALDRVDPLGQPDHLAHPAARLAADEVVAHPRAQVAAGADVERRALRVAEDVDAGLRPACRRPGAACAAAPRLTCAVNERSSGSDWTPRLPSRPISPCSTSTVARASSSAR